MIRRCKKAGLPEPEIRIDGGFFVVTIRRKKPESGVQSGAKLEPNRDQVTGQVTGQVDPWLIRALTACAVKPLSSRKTRKQPVSATAKPSSAITLIRSSAKDWWSEPSLKNPPVASRNTGSRKNPIREIGCQRCVWGLIESPKKGGCIEAGQLPLAKRRKRGTGLIRRLRPKNGTGHAFSRQIKKN